MKKNQRVMLTRRLLRESLLRLLAERPLEKISITALCHEAEINRTTFYHHYTTPADVLSDIEAELVRELNEIARDRMPGDRASTVALCRKMAEHADELRVLFRCNVDAQLETIIRKLQENLIALSATKPQIAADDEIGISLAATFIGSGIYYLIRRWILEQIPLTPEQITDLIFAILSD